jgi:hypothetical protein
MSLFDSTTGVQPDSRDTEKARDFLIQKYEKKRWYAPPNDLVLNQIKCETDLLLNSTNSACVTSKNPVKSQNHSTTQQKVEIKPPAKQRDLSINTNNFMSLNSNRASVQAADQNSQSQATHTNELLFSTFDSGFGAITTNGGAQPSVTQNTANFANFDLFENLTAPSNSNSTSYPGEFCLSNILLLSAAAYCLVTELARLP